MKTLKFKLSADILFILKILKEENVLNFEKKIPYFLIGTVYDFIWSLIFKAKILSKYKEKKGIDLVDIKIAFILKIKKRKHFEFCTNNSKLIINLINKQKFHQTTGNLVFKFPVSNKLITNADYKVLGNIFIF
nr:transcription initiation factor TFIID subunit 9 [Cryptomonas curvata]